MDVLAALLPPAVVAVAFITLAIVVFRHTDRSANSRRADHDPPHQDER